MENKDKYQFIGQDLSSGHTEPEDIVSDSRYLSKSGHYKKKTHSKFRRWWKRRKQWQKVAMISVVSMVLVFAIALGVLRIVFDYNYNAITRNKDELGFENVIDKKIVNIALFGIDTRDTKSFKGLSDSIMIISLNTETKKIKLISIMRDSLVPINDGKTTKYTKINSAYSKGGPVLAIKTLNTNFGLDISEYATVNFAGMSKIIDAVGGIEATLTDGELDVYGYENGHRVNWGLNGLISDQCGYLGISSKGMFITKGGTYHLNGVQAVAYARIRHAANAEGTNDDYGRTDRQRYVMEQLFNKAITMEKSQYVTLAKAMIPCCETSLSYSEIMGLAFDILLKSPTFEQTRVPQFEYQMSSRSYVYYDLDYAGKLIRAFIYDDIKPEEYMETYGIEKNDWYPKANSGGRGSGKTTSSGTTSGTNKNPASSTPPVTSSKPDTDSSVVSSEPTESSEPPSSGPEGTVSNPDSSQSTPSTPSQEPSSSTPSSDSGIISSGSASTESPSGQG